MVMGTFIHLAHDILQISSIIYSRKAFSIQNVSFYLRDAAIII